MWDFLGLPQPTKVQLDIAWNLQHGEKQIIIEAFRGIGKSWITVAFVLWNFLLDPQKKIMVVSASEGLAQDFTKFCYQLIEGMPMLQHLAPREGQRSSQEKFDVGPARPSKDPSLKSVGITGQLTGSRADIIIGDDIEVPKNSLTPNMRDRLAELVKEFSAVLKPLSTSRIIYLGTPQTEESLYNRLAGRGYTIRIWPAEVPTNTARYQGRLAPMIQRMVDADVPAGTPVEPTRFPKNILEEKIAEYGAAGYALQFMLDTSPADAEKHPLKARDLIVMDTDVDMAPVKVAWSNARDLAYRDLPCGGFEGDGYFNPMWLSPEMAPYGGTVMYLDPSGRGNDETSGAIVKLLHSQLFLVDCFGYLDGFGEATLRAIANRAARHKVNWIVAEKNYGGGMFDSLLKPYLASVFTETESGPQRLPAGRFDEEWKGWSVGQKELRICNTLEPIMQSHRLIVSRKVIEDDRKVLEERPTYSLIYQMTRMSRLKNALPHDDRIEAVAGACAYFTERMNQDRDKAVEKRRNEALDKELRKFSKHVLGKEPRRARWV